MKLSIVTINYNNAEGLKKTLDSVASQTFHEFEHIIVDGASTDDSVKVIESYVRDVSCMKYDVLWVSEPDTGIYNAMNHGVEIAMGKRVVNEDHTSLITHRSSLQSNCDRYCLFLNSGDWFVNKHVLERIHPELEGTDIIQGNIVRTRDGKKYVDCGYGKSDINFIDVQQGHFLHQASFCRLSLFEQYGYFDESYRIHGDTVFYIKCLGYGNATFRYVNQTIADFAPGGMSDSVNPKVAEACEKEYQRWTTELFSPRLWQTCVEYDKKGRMYDTLHRHPFLWKCAMALLKFAKCLEK